MKDFKGYLATIILASALISCPLLAHEGEAHEEETEDAHLATSFLNGKWQIRDDITTSPSARVNPQVRFHAGHEHPPEQGEALMILNFCTDKEDTLYGIVQNNGLVESAEDKLKVSLSVHGEDDNAFDITVVPFDEAVEAEDLTFNLISDDTESSNAAIISFDGGATYYEATRKNNKVTTACKKFMRKEIKNNQN